jgi:hypothetical protein
MIYCSAYRIYLLIFYVLLQSKEKNVYNHAFQMCIAATDWQLNGLTVTCDYEAG